MCQKRWPNTKDDKLNCNTHFLMRLYIYIIFCDYNGSYRIFGAVNCLLVRGFKILMLNIVDTMWKHALMLNILSSQ